jgi:hypothetical protein
MLTFEAKLRNGKTSEIRFHRDERGFVGELCVKGKCDLVLQTKEELSEVTAWNLAKMVFDDTYGDRMIGMRRKDE